MVSQERSDDLTRIFMPYASKRIDYARKNEIKFSHYTTAETAISIIDKQEIWLRNAVLMNDFSEISHGHNCLAQSWHEPSMNKRLKSIFEAISPDLYEKVTSKFDALDADRQLNTYMVSISEHGNEHGWEDKYGRLSMWRAYGGRTNVAFVFKSASFLKVQPGVSAYSSPVAYEDSESFKSRFEEVLDSLEANLDAIKELDSNQIERVIDWALRFAVLSTKHPGFSEEREWRILYSPSWGASKNIAAAHKVIGGVPQIIYKLKLENNPEFQISGFTIAEALEEIIIGPTDTPWPIHEALAEKLTAIGVDNAMNKVRVSNIPLRR
ncbi:DUF2971 domain-containing protein [Acuticoccus sediminis]|uniref:DUF2971 domain-containing protein n=1 Tax=Acuticoccus sediminis TaxID=2184697 RepID=UPI001CFE7AD5|nr:DUF2971 domain-containing protein [Acuticoccus sediminis]